MSYYGNRLEKLQYQKEYNLKNKDKIKEYQREYYLNIIKPTRIDFNETYKPLPEYKLKLIRRVIKKKLKEYKRQKMIFKSEDPFIMYF